MQSAAASVGKRRETRGQSKTGNKQRHVDEPWTSLVAKQVCLKPVKRTTCADFVAKSRTTVEPRYFELG